MINFSEQKVTQVTPLSELPPEVVKQLPDVDLEAAWEEPNPILLIPKSRESIRCDKNAGRYFAGGLPALMQAVRALQQNPNAKVTYVNDGQLRKSTQSAHQGHVHPTEWTIEECQAKNLVKLLLHSLHIVSPAPPEDVSHYSYLHFPLAKMRPTLFMRFFVHRVIHTLFSKNGVSADDRWQCEAVRASLAFHESLSEEIVAAGGEPTFTQNERIMWSPVRESLERKRALWNEVGIATEFMSEEELRREALFKEGAPIFALKVFGDGKFFADVDGKICDFLLKAYANSFFTRRAIVSELYIDETTKEPFAVRERFPDGSGQTVAIDSFFGSTGHSQVFKVDPVRKKKRALWHEVPVTGVSTLWLASIAKSTLLSRLGKELSDEALRERLKAFAGLANHTNMHVTIWDAIVAGESVHIIARATQGANFNSTLADPNDLLNMTANLKRFFIGDWKLISAGSCIRKTAISNVPEMKENFIHGLSGIGFSFSAVPRDMLNYKPMAEKLIDVFRWR